MMSPESVKPELKALTENSSVVVLTDNTLNETQITLPTNKFIPHNAKSGLNPLVDAAAYLFSIVGKLKLLKSYRHLDKLQKELISEINAFHDNAKSHGYSSEYLLVSRYALCVTFDDIIQSMPWGCQGQWDNYNLLAAFNQEPTNQNHERFFLILDRIIKDPELYLDLMEFMYICLSLGFKGNYRTTEFGLTHLENITNALYKRIRSSRGDFNKMLSPFPIKMHHSIKQKKIPAWIIISLSIGIIFILFLGLGHMLDMISNQAYQELIRIGKSILYDNH